MQGKIFLASKSGGLTDSNASAITAVPGDPVQAPVVWTIYNELSSMNDLKRSFQH